MLECHANAWFIKPGKCLGRKLKHLTPARLFLLEAIKSPFIFGGLRSIDDLFSSVLICSTSPSVSKWLMQHHAVLGIACFLWGMDVRLRRLNVMDEAANFGKYITVYMDHPPAKIREGEHQRDSAFPSSVCIVWTLMERMPENRAWQVPMPLAMVFTGRQAEYNGTEFQSETDKGRPFVQIISDETKEA